MGVYTYERRRHGLSMADPVTLDGWRKARRPKPFYY